MSGVVLRVGTRRNVSWDQGSYLAFDIDTTECGRTGVFEQRSCLAGEEAYFAVVFPFDEMLATMLTDEVDALS